MPGGGQAQNTTPSGVSGGGNDTLGSGSLASSKNRGGGRKKDPARSAFQVEGEYMTCKYCATKMSTTSAAERLRLHLMACTGNVPLELKSAVKRAEDAGLERARKRAQTVLSLTERVTLQGAEAPTLRDTRMDKKKKQKAPAKPSSAPPGGSAMPQGAASADNTNAMPSSDADASLEEKRMAMELAHEQKLAEQKMQTDLALSILQSPNIPEELRSRALKVLDKHLPE